MPFIHKHDDGTEETMYYASEVAEIEQQKVEFENKVKHLETVGQEKSDNIKKLRDMTEQEKEQFTKAELESRSIIESLQDELAKTKNELTSKQQGEIEKARNEAIRRYVGSDTELQKRFLEEYNIIAIDEKDADSVNTRAEKAARMIGITSGASYNPLNTYWEGEAPSVKAKTAEKEKDEFFKEGKGKAVMDFLGDNA
jgi:molybdopterin converting factor small subunit